MLVLTKTPAQMALPFKKAGQLFADRLAEYQRSQKLEEQLQHLTDPGLIDRILEERGTVFNPQPPVRPVRPLRSIDGVIRAQLV